MKRSAGFSLMETLAALALLALLLLGVMASLDTIARSTHASLAATQ
jgi:general secretion pathway protein J